VTEPDHVGPGSDWDGPLASDFRTWQASIPFETIRPRVQSRTSLWRRTNQCWYESHT